MAITKKPYPQTVVNAVNEHAAVQVGFDIIVEQVIGHVAIEKNGYGVTPVVAAFGVVAEHVEKRTKVDGEANLTFRFELGGQLYKLDINVL